MSIVTTFRLLVVFIVSTVVTRIRRRQRPGGVVGLWTADEVVVSEVSDEVERRSRDVVLLDLERLSDSRASKNSSPSAEGDFHLTRARAGGGSIECLSSWPATNS